MRIIPAIDIIDGKCVRLSKGDYSTQKTYNENPLEVAKAFEDHGIQYLHLVDLDGAKSKHIVNHKVLETLASKTSLSIDFGGGLKTDEDLRIAFESGAKQVTGGSIAVKETELQLIASGGISQFDELSRLAEMGCEGTIIGKAIYENRISLKQLEAFILIQS